MSVNLLPESIIHRRRIYAQCIRLLTVQSIIVFILLLLIFMIDVAINWRYAEINVLNAKIQEERFISSDLTAEAISEHHAKESDQLAKAALLALPVFNVMRLYTIKESLPIGVELLQVDMNENGATMELKAQNLSLADVHGEGWIYTGLVYSAQLTSAYVARDGSVRYTLTLHWAYES